MNQIENFENYRNQFAISLKVIGTSLL